MCYMEPNCVSINVGPVKGGKHECELNDATEENRVATALHSKKNYIYLGIEVRDTHRLQFQCGHAPRLI